MQAVKNKLLEALVLMGSFFHSNIGFKNKLTGHKQSTRFLECIEDNFPDRGGWGADKGESFYQTSYLQAWSGR